MVTGLTGITGYIKYRRLVIGDIVARILKTGSWKYCLADYRN
jgi:hypothetical protein